MFYQLLTGNGKSKSGEEGWSKVAKWRQFKGDVHGLLGRRYLLMPMNSENTHWWFAVVCNLNRIMGGERPKVKAEVPRIICLDSAVDEETKQKRPKDDDVALLRGYIWREWCRSENLDEKSNDCKAKRLMLDQTLKNTDAEVPLQHNDYDCGIFII